MHLEYFRIMYYAHKTEITAIGPSVKGDSVEINIASFFS